MPFGSEILWISTISMDIIHFNLNFTLGVNWEMLMWFQAWSNPGWKNLQYRRTDHLFGVIFDLRFLFCFLRSAFIQSVVADGGECGVFSWPFRDEQYRIMWNELETLVRAHINNSDKHQRVLECLMACRSKPPEEEERKKRGRKREDKEDKSEKLGKDYESDKPWQESERYIF